MGNAAILIQLLLEGATRLQQYGALLAKAHAEGRDVTAAELAQCRADDDAARDNLQRLINERR